MSAPDSVRIFLNAIQSGLVVSGNAYITASRIVTSGDAISSFTVSGKTDYIGLRLQRDTTNPLTGGYTEVADIVTADILHHEYTPNATGVTDANSSIAVVSRLVSDYKATVSGYAWSGVAPPKLVSESHPMSQAQFSKAQLSYRVRYLL